MSEKKHCGYVGKISHNGAQKVKAPLSGNVSKGKGSVKSGDDLRSGKK